MPPAIGVPWRRHIKQLEIAGAARAAGRDDGAGERRGTADRPRGGGAQPAPAAAGGSGAGGGTICDVLKGIVYILFFVIFFIFVIYNRSLFFFVCFSIIFKNGNNIQPKFITSH